MSSHPSPEMLSRLDGLPSGRRDELLRHLRGCSACRSEWAAADPSRLFSMLCVRELPGDLLDRVSAGVFSAIEADAPAPSRIAGTWNLRTAGALAAGILLAVALVLFTGQGPEIGSPVDSVAELGEIAPGATVALLESPGEARVVDLTMGETRVVMIFDQELDL